MKYYFKIQNPEYDITVYAYSELFEDTEIHYAVYNYDTHSSHAIFKSVINEAIENGSAKGDQIRITLMTEEELLLDMVK